MEHLRTLHPPRRFISGEKFPFLGGLYPLVIEQGSPTGLDFAQEQIIFRSRAAEATWQEDQRAQLYEKFKRSVLAAGKQLLRERLAFWSQRTELQPTGLQFRQQKSVWGSCSAQNKISLNLKLIVAPIWVIDYVLIHELAHIRHKNHSADFWQLVDRYTPHRDRARSWLRENVYLGDFLGARSDLHPPSATEES